MRAGSLEHKQDVAARAVPDKAAEEAAGALRRRRVAAGEQAVAEEVLDSAEARGGRVLPFSHTRVRSR